MDDLGYDIWQAQAYIDKVLEQLQNRPQDISQKRLKYIRDSLNYVENDISCLLYTSPSPRDS